MSTGFLRKRRRCCFFGGLPSIDPRNLPGLELYLQADSIAQSDNTAVASWADQSGHVRNAGQAVAVVQPTFRSTGTALSLNGLPAVVFDGLDGPNGDFMTGVFPAGQISSSLGMTCYFYGRFRPAVNAFGAQVFFQDDTGQNPQLIAQANYAWRDTVGTKAFTAFAAGVQLLTYVFNPPNVTGTGEVFKDNVSQGTATWNFDPFGSTGYVVGANQAGNVAMNCDMWTLAWFSRAHDTATRQAVERFFRNKWG